jgi:hypothetical protein
MKTTTSIVMKAASSYVFGALLAGFIHHDWTVAINVAANLIIFALCLIFLWEI